MDHLSKIFPTITAIALNATAPADVILRGGDRVEAPILAVNESGVRIGGDAPRWLSWDRVRIVEGEFASAAAPFAEISTDLWRARTRLARGDAVLAEPLFNELFVRYREADGPTAAVVAMGVLECALARQNIRLAFEAWGVAARQLELGNATTLVPGSEPAQLLDPETLLCPQLHPSIALDADDATLAILEAIANRGGVSGQLAEMYASATQPAAATDSPATSQHPGVRLLRTTIRTLSQTAHTDADAASDTHQASSWQAAWHQLAELASPGPDLSRAQAIDALFSGLTIVYTHADRYPFLALSAASHTQRSIGTQLGSEARTALSTEMQRITRDVLRQTGLSPVLHEHADSTETDPSTGDDDA